MKRLFLVFSAFSSMAIAQTGPGGVGKTDGSSSLRLWLDASDVSTKTLNVTNVTQWNDKSGNGYNASQATASQQPANNGTGINSRQTITFDGTNDRFDLPNASVLANNAPFSFFALVKPSIVAAEHTIFSAGTNANYIHLGIVGTIFFYDQSSTTIVATGGLTTLSSGTAYIYYAQATSSVSLYLNGTIDIPDDPITTAAIPNDERSIGGPTSGFTPWAGDIAEVVVYNVALNSAERTIVGSYLAAKWGTTFSGSKYTGFNSSYTNDVVGIGLESDGANHDAQGAGIRLSDGGNLFDVGGYLLAGHQNSTGTTASDVVSGVTKRWSRIWYIDQTGASLLPITIAFDFGDAGFNGNPANAANYKLLYRSGTSGNFSSVTTNFSSIVNTDQVEFEIDSQNILDGYYTLGTTNEATSPLPVELVSFNASPKDNSVELKWTSATEANNYGFEIERKVLSNRETANNWQKVGSLEGSGTSSSPHDYSFIDHNLAPGRYAYRIRQINADGSFTYTKEVDLEVNLAPRVFALGQNYPNPFNPTTDIEFTIPSDGLSTLRVYNAIGQKVATLFDGVAKAEEYHHVVFDASRLASGIYFARLQYGQRQLTQKMILIK
jgi:hypothetical protein